MRKVLIAGACVCFFILLGTVGALETDTITTWQALARMAIFLPIMLACVITAKRKDV